MRKKQRGFSVVEVLLVVIAITLVVGVGYYIYNSNKDKDAKKSTTTSAQADGKDTPANPALTLDLAVKQTQTVYDAFLKYQTGGNGISIVNGKRWDYSFINANKSWFSQSFISKTNAVKVSDDGPDYSLICVSGSAMLDATPVSPGSVTGKTAKVSVKDISVSLPVTLIQSNSSWLIDNIDLSSCPQ